MHVGISKNGYFWRFYGYKIAIFEKYHAEIHKSNVEEQYLSYEIGLIQKYLNSCHLSQDLPYTHISLIHSQTQNLSLYKSISLNPIIRIWQSISLSITLSLSLYLNLSKALSLSLNLNLILSLNLSLSRLIFEI